MNRLIPRDPVVVAPGAVHIPGWLDTSAQLALAASCREWAREGGGLRSPRLPTGGVMSVKITCLGWHWYPYRYSRTVDDGDGRPVTEFPGWLGDLSRRAVTDACGLDVSVSEGPVSEGPVSEGPVSDVALGGGPPVGCGRVGDDYRPDVALVNWYGPGARMGMHADRDERTTAPVVSLSVGEPCVFRFGTPAGRGRPWTDVVLESGDLFVFGGPSRLAYHGVPKLLSGAAAPPGAGLDEGRFNVTVRQSGLAEPGGDGPERTEASNRFRQ